jgi:DNA repair protein RadC
MSSQKDLYTFCESPDEADFGDFTGNFGEGLEEHFAGDLADLAEDIPEDWEDDVCASASAVAVLDSMTYLTNTRPGKPAFPVDLVGRRPRVREKVLKRGVGAADNQELLMVLLGSGMKGRNVRSVAMDVVHALADTNSADRMETLVKIPGVGQAKALMIAAALELGRRYHSYQNIQICSPRDAIPLVQHYAYEPQEHFTSLLLNGAHEVEDMHLIGMGTATRVLTHPREVFAEALKQRAAAVVLCHNHPGEVAKPSQEDIVTTRMLLEASRCLSITLLDHIIVTKKSYYSFREQGLMGGYQGDTYQ